MHAHQYEILTELIKAPFPNLVCMHAHTITVDSECGPLETLLKTILSTLWKNGLLDGNKNNSITSIEKWIF